MAWMGGVMNEYIVGLIEDRMSCWADEWLDECFNSVGDGWMDGRPKT